MADKSSESPDFPCLTSTTSLDGEPNQKEQINTSEQITTSEGKSDLSTPDYLREFNALYSGLSPESSASISPVSRLLTTLFREEEASLPYSLTTLVIKTSSGSRNEGLLDAWKGLTMGMGLTRSASPLPWLLF
jgi:hypothetical protein